MGLQAFGHQRANELEGIDRRDLRRRRSLDRTGEGPQCWRRPDLRMVVAAIFIGTMIINALEGLFERLVLIDKIDPATGEARKHPRERKATFVGAANVMSYLMLESTSFGQATL